MRTTASPPVVPVWRVWRGAAAYALLLVGGVGLFLLVRVVGEGLTAPDAPVVASAVTPQAGRVNVVVHVLATVTAVVGVGYVLGLCCWYVGQPRVIGEILAGILLGPSLLGAVAPGAMHALIPPPATDPGGQVTAALKAIAQLGVIFYMFLIGLELNAPRLRRFARTSVAVSHASIVFPLVLGSVLALWLYPLLSHSGVPFTTFALFMGVALSVTAFPVLARILTDRGLEKTEVGLVALGCAAADDVTAWCLLAIVVGVAQSRAHGAAHVLIGAGCFIAAMFLVVRPLLGRCVRRLDTAAALPPLAVSGTVLLVLLCALTTEMIGIHALFGAFLLGVVIPHDSWVARELVMKLKTPVTVLGLPVFFAYTGMRTEIGLVSGWGDWLICGAIVFVATLGKLGGTLLAARLTGHSWRDALVLGTLMNTRGLMELVVLNIGLDLGIISPRLFAMMVLMALLTTIAAAPCLRWLVPATATEADSSPL